MWYCYKRKEDRIMTAILKCIHKLEERFDRKAEAFAFHHPLLAFLAMFVGMPIVILLLVSFSTMLISMPLAYLFGW